jgi:catechol 2,3-dioxygenase-like lactoylglutathione lyase family enzyme
MSKVETPKTDAIMFEGVTPVLRVKDLSASIDYYVHVLGFKVNWQHAGFFAAVSRGGCCIFLSVGDQGNPGAWVWIGVSDAEALFEEYRAKGAKIRNPPNSYEWALEMQVEDLDGNVLRLGSDSKSDQPVGEWLDMHGKRWKMSIDGEWVRIDGD